MQGVIQESTENIARVIRRTNKIYSNTIDGLARQDLSSLKKSKKQVGKLSDEIDELRDNIFYFIKNLDESSVKASDFYLNILDLLTDIAQGLEFISKASHKHINNNHKKLKFSQIKELKDLDKKFEALLNDCENAFHLKSFNDIGVILNKKDEMYALMTNKIHKQILRTREEESSPKNTTLYFSLLQETKDLFDAVFELLEEFYKSHDSSVEPATIDSDR